MINGKWNTHINTSNIVFPNKKSIFYALEIYTESAHLNYPAPVIQSEIHSIFSVPPSTDERHMKYDKRKTKCFGYLSHTYTIA